jgi:hypothetical protein
MYKCVKILKKNEVKRTVDVRYPGGSTPSTTDDIIKIYESGRD